jgi:hypothetical protein
MRFPFAMERNYPFDGGRVNGAADLITACLLAQSRDVLLDWRGDFCHESIFSQSGSVAHTHG